MTGEILLYVIAGVIVIALGVGVWVLDAKRNEEVEHDDARLDTDTDATDTTTGTPTGTPTDGTTGTPTDTATGPTADSIDPDSRPGHHR